MKVSSVYNFDFICQMELARIIILVCEKDLLMARFMCLNLDNILRDRRQSDFNHLPVSYKVMKVSCDYNFDFTGRMKLAKISMLVCETIGSRLVII